MKNIIASTAIQTMKKMTTKLALGLIALTLAGTTPAIAGDQVTRPTKSKGHVVVFVDLSTYKGTGSWDDFNTWDGPPIFPWVSTSTGTATHSGAYINTSAGITDFLAGENNGAGVSVAANGDETWTTWFETTPSGEEPGVNSFTGGTGRFEGATGSTVEVQSNRVVDYYYDADLDILFEVIEFDSEGTGFITY